MKKLATVLIVLGLMLPSFGQAQVTSGQAQVTSKLKGVVAGSCGEWVEWREDKSFDILIKSGVVGFMVGMNVMRGLATKGNSEGVNIPDATTIVLYVDMYCRENPLVTVAVGLTSLWVELYKKQAG